MGEGRLVIAGGSLGERAQEVFTRLNEAAQMYRPGGKIAILPAATLEPDASIESARRGMELAGIDPARIIVLPICVAKPEWESGARDPEVLRMLADCSALWMLGGSQDRLFSALMNQDGTPSPAFSAIQVQRDAGLVVGGSSAGAAVMSDPMIRSGTSAGAFSGAPGDEPGEGEISHPLCLGRGYGFFREGIVDQHFDTRARFGRLFRACAESGSPVCRGFGVSEATAIEYDPVSRTFEVLGAGYVLVLEPDRGEWGLKDCVRGDPVLPGSFGGDSYGGDSSGESLAEGRLSGRQSSGEKSASEKSSCEKFAGENFAGGKVVIGRDGSVLEVRGFSLHILRAGDRYNAALGMPEFPNRTLVSPGDTYFDLPRPEAWGPFSPFCELSAFLGSMLLDNNPDGLYVHPDTGLKGVRAYLVEPEGSPGGSRKGAKGCAPGDASGSTIWGSPEGDGGGKIRRRAWEFTFSILPGQSSLWTGNGVSLAWVGLDVDPLWLDLSPRNLQNTGG